jgi:hypothetical protein
MTEGPVPEDVLGEDDVDFEGEFEDQPELDPEEGG